LHPNLTFEKYLGQFFNWAIRKDYYDKNPVEKIQIHVQTGVPPRTRFAQGAQPQITTFIFVQTITHGPQATATIFTSLGVIMRIPGAVGQ
jgi:hypothetical protein